MSAANFFRLSLPALKLSVPMYITRFESGTSASTQITGMPCATALSISPWKISGLGAERQIPAGFCSTIWRKTPTSPFGSYVVGPVSSPFTPSPLAASKNPAWASCQYGKLMFVATKTYRAFSSWYGLAHDAISTTPTKIKIDTSVAPYLFIGILLLHSSWPPKIYWTSTFPFPLPQARQTRCRHSTRIGVHCVTIEALVRQPRLSNTGILD